MVYLVEFRPSKAEEGRSYVGFFFFYSDGDIRADAPRWWIIRYMNNCGNYSGESMVRGDTLLIIYSGKNVLQSVIWCQKERGRGGLGVLEVLLMVAQYCRGLVGRGGSKVWPSWEAAVLQGKNRGARNILVWGWCLVQWLFPLLASLPLHNTSDVCVLLEAPSVLI